MTRTVAELDPQEKELHNLLEWREDQLRKLGIPEDDLDVLVENHHIDIHEVYRLVRMKNCPVHMVRPILL